MAELVNFTPDFVPNGYPDRVQRHAVLAALAGPIAGGEALEGDVVSKTLRVVKRWRARIHALGDAGWPPFAASNPRGMLNRAYAANCCPSFLAVEQRTRHCGRAPCPFCWARRSLAVWEAADHAFFASPEARRGAGADAPPVLPRSVHHDLVEWTVTVPERTLLRGREAGELKDHLHSRLASLVAQPGRAGSRRLERWRRWRDGQGVLGGVEATRLCLVHGRLNVLIRRLLIVPAGFEAPADWTRGKAESTMKARVVPRPSRKDVVAAVARATRYPAGWMTGDARTVAAILGAGEGLKLTAHFGLFRNASAREREAKTKD